MGFWTDILFNWNNRISFRTINFQYLSIKNQYRKSNSKWLIKNMGNLLRLITGESKEDSQQIFLDFESKCSFQRHLFMFWFSFYSYTFLYKQFSVYCILYFTNWSMPNKRVWKSLSVSWTGPTGKQHLLFSQKPEQVVCQFVVLTNSIIFLWSQRK